MGEAPVSRNLEVWKNLYEKGRNDLKYPSDMLVRIGSRALDLDHFPRLLDFGFGTGANLLHFARLGHGVFGLEISSHALAKAQARIDQEGLCADLRLYVPGTPFPFPDASFDGVVAWQVLYYNTWATLGHAVREIERVIRPGGKVLAAMAAPGDISQSQADSLGDSLYRSRVPGQEGCIVVIPAREELARCFPGRNLEVGSFGFDFGGVQSRFWIVQYLKP